MKSSFITFILFSSDLDDPALLRSITSIREQDTLCWSIELRVPVLPVISRSLNFTHDNPRISIISEGIRQCGEAFSSDVYTILPIGLELLPSACSSLKIEFESIATQVVILNNINHLENHSPIHTSSLSSIISVVRCDRLVRDSQWLREISIPLVIVNASDSASTNYELETSASDVDFPASDLIENIRMKARHIDQLNKDKLILKHQLQSLLARLHTLEIHSVNLEVANDGLMAANNALNEANNLMHKSNLELSTRKSRWFKSPFRRRG